MSVPAAFAGRLALPAVAAPMFLVSGPDLVIASCKAGVVGTFPALNQRTSTGFEEWLETITAALAEAERVGKRPAPFGVNLVVHRSNPRLEADLVLCETYKVPLIITSLGAVSDLVKRVHAYGGLVFHDVINLRHAEKAAAAGVDGLILVCAGAGGHAGTLSPFAFVPEVRRFFKGTILLAGAMSDGRAVAAARIMGADLAYLGSRFIATTESLAYPAFKDMVVAGNANDIVYTQAISGVLGNFLRPSIRAAGLDPDDLPEKTGGFQTSELEPEDPRNEVKAWKTVWSAGQGIGSITDIPSTADLVRRLAAEYKAAAAGIVD